MTSHDLKAPLRGIASLAQWIEEDLSDKLTADTRHQMELLRGRVRRMEALIEGILAYSRATRFREKPESVDLERLAREVVELIAPRPPAQVTLDVPPATLRTYKVPLQQVLMNLILNARDAMPRGGRLEISTEADDDAVKINVRDTGVGIAPEHLTKIYDPFFTTKQIGKGTGLGLAVSYGIIRDHGGHITVESKLSEGTLFQITLPLATARQQLAAASD